MSLSIILVKASPSLAEIDDVQNRRGFHFPAGTDLKDRNVVRGEYVESNQSQCGRNTMCFLRGLAQATSRTQVTSSHQYVNLFWMTAYV